ncbi:unnamed protein product [Notodromas monacha]|uniref:Uncharacterized protein n=1 Tax=Notodromas monacha TaxID=399045 RepID=A0A7R9BTD0_9CRUS|nr:unnamed protein product [Notodromas monacha]CAG0920331.1 unnamed protein product [Notodromas monacha]
MWSSQEVTDQPEACQEAGAFGDEPSAPPLVLEEHQETEEHVSESGDKLKIDNEPQQPKAAPRHCRQDRGIRATVGIDIDTKLPVFRGAEKLPLSCSSSSLSSLSNPQDEPKPRQKKSSTAGMATRGMQVKDYFANFDSTDAVSMMNPYLTACAHLLDVEYLLSSLLEMKSEFN